MDIKSIARVHMRREFAMLDADGSVLDTTVFAPQILHLGGVQKAEQKPPNNREPRNTRKLETTRLDSA